MLAPQFNIRDELCSSLTSSLGSEQNHDLSTFSSEAHSVFRLQCITGLMFGSLCCPSSLDFGFGGNTVNNMTYETM